MRDIYVDSEGGTLEIHLIGAKNLKAADRNGLSDPFCVTSLESLYTLHNREFIDERQSNTSPVCKKTLSPIWNVSVQEYYS
jgi:Ca2+-dependent lipid-binding protein